jgi:hypothetical protein
MGEMDLSTIADSHIGMRMAVIVAIEEYRKGPTAITSVKYASNDALRFKEILITCLGYKDEEITVLINQDAVKAAFENDIPYYIRQLTAEHQFIFYYVGHGFYQDGDNKLTCWDSHPFNLSETSVSIKDFVIDPLQRSACRESLIFLDCCSSYLKGIVSSRDVIADLDTSEFEDFIAPIDAHAVFMSCSPGEKSYSSDILKQGIWTWHLAEALSGNAERAIVRDHFITNVSLQNYLSYVVPKYIIGATTIHGTQKPYAKMRSSNDFKIRKIPAIATEIDNSLPDFKFNYTRAIFRKIDYEKIKDAEGFKSGYKIPKWKNSNSVGFVQKVFEPEIEREIQEIYENTKSVTGLRKAQIEYGSSLDGGSVECPLFRYYVEVDLEESNLSKAKITRKLEIRIPRAEIPEGFDTIFPIYLDELIIPIEGEMDFDDIVNKFENLKEAQGGSLSDNESKEIMEYITKGGTSITIDVQQKELIITHYSPMRSLDLVDKSIDDLKRISSHKIRLLG